MITIKQDAKVLTARSTPYDFKGNVGVSHKVRFNIDGEVYAIKTTEEVVNKYKPLEGRDGVVTLEMASPKETLQLNLVSFEE